MRYFYTMGKYQEALQCGRRVAGYITAFKGSREEQDYYFMYSLTLLAICKTSRPLLPNGNGSMLLARDDDDKASTTQLLLLSTEEEECLENIKIVTETQKKFKKWSDAAEINYRHQYLLVEAELARVR